MKITLEVDYGIGGALPPLVFDAKLLSPEDAGHLARLVAAAKAEESNKRVEATAEAEKSNKRGGRVGDTIRIEDADGKVELKQPISEMSEAFKALRSWLNEHSRQGTRNNTR